MRDVSTEMPPPGALVWPSSEEPTPRDHRHTMRRAGAHDLLHLGVVSGKARHRAPASEYRWWYRVLRRMAWPVWKRSPAAA